MERRDFPALAVRPHGKRLAYLDSAATALRPRAVIDAVAAAMELGAPSRSVHVLAEAATEAIEAARRAVADFIGGAASEVVFTSGTTAAINLVAAAWGARLGPGDVVVVTEAEHHSNLVPWQMTCAARGATLRVCPVDANGHAQLDLTGAKLVAIAHVSNVLGTIAPIAEISRRAHAVGAKVLVDGAQAVAHMPIDVGALGCDFYAFSAHKLYGPTGTGVLWSSQLEDMPPWQGGGGMIGRVSATSSTYREAPARFEAGTPNTAGIVGLHAAIDYVVENELHSRDESHLHARLIEVVTNAGGRVLGAPEVGVVAFELPRVHPHDVATICDQEGVALRSGHHCAAPLHARFDVAASSRVSVGCYTDDDDVEQFARALAKVREVFP
ncbi:MAG: aminotransferase class V-fold PLP-dependent enzyme [Kofleriaceae bacterium]